MYIVNTFRKIFLAINTNCVILIFTKGGIFMAFKDELRRLRKQDGLTQAALAKRLGISKSTISMYECGRREPDFETLEAIADLFNVDMNELTGHTSDELIRTVGGWATTQYLLDKAGISEQEYSFILAYRQASPDDRQIIDNIVSRYASPAVKKEIG